MPIGGLSQNGQATPRHGTTTDNVCEAAATARASLRETCAGHWVQGTLHV